MGGVIGRVRKVDPNVRNLTPSPPDRPTDRRATTAARAESRLELDQALFVAQIDDVSVARKGPQSSNSTPIPKEYPARGNKDNPENWWILDFS